MHKAAALTASVAALLGASLSSSLVRAAANLGVNVGADLVYHSNAALVSSDVKSDLDRVGRARIAFDNPDPQLQAKLDYQAERHDYQDDVQADRTIITGAANIKWAALERFLDFTLEHEVSDQLQDRRGANVESNVERRSILRAGSDLYAHLSKVDTVVINPSFSQVSLQSTTGSDSHSSALSLSWRHAMSAVSALQLSGTREFRRFDDSVNNYNADRVLLGLNTQLSHLSYFVGGGLNRIERDQGKNANGFSAQISADYTETYYSWGGVVIRQLTDTSVGLSSFEQTLTDFQATDGNVDQFDIVETTQVELHGRRQLTASSSLSGSVGYTRQDYQVTARDENSYIVALGYSYDVNPLWAVGLNGRYGMNDFLDDPNNLKQRDSQLDLFLQYRSSEWFSARFGVGRQQRNANVSTTEYRDNYISASVNFLLY